jgi:hypothetical protein
MTLPHNRALNAGGVSKLSSPVEIRLGMQWRPTVAGLYFNCISETPTLYQKPLLVAVSNDRYYGISPVYG